MDPKQNVYPVITTDGIAEWGITVRDHVAIEAMKALIARWDNEGPFSFEFVSSRAYKYADALIEESNKKAN